MVSVQELREQTKAKNDEVKQLSVENRRKITELKSAFQQATDSKKARDEANAKVKALAPEKKRIQDEQKKAVAELKVKQAELKKLDLHKHQSAAKLKEIIDAMEWKLQTESMSPKKEKEISIEIAKLEKERKAAAASEPVRKAISEIRRKLDALNAEFDKVNSELSANFKAGRAAHEKAISTYHKASAIRGEVNRGFKQQEEKAREADETYGQLSKAREESHEEWKKRQAAAEQNARAHHVSQRNFEREKLERERRILQQEEDKTLEALKSGKKIVL